ncbi:MAG: Stk1 family PASTA domain-containing Ser/Thr kinase [Acidimicrobiales bacterium]
MTDASTARPIVGGRYELERRLARGGMADIHLARDRVLDREVAVKVLFPQYADDPAFVERFRREALSAGKLNHPNVVSVYDWGAHDDTYFIVMEFVDGQSLAELLASRGRLPTEEALEITARTAAALGFAHDNGMVHRDVKPGNIILTSTGQVKVADFGIARALESGDQLTQTGKVLGTAAYFSPEQAQGHTVDHRSDLYSLGVVLFEMVTGERPFTGGSPVSIAYKHVETAPPTARSLHPGVPPVVDDIIARLLAKSPDDRYPDAVSLVSDLRRAARGEPVQARPAPATMITPEANGFHDGEATRILATEVEPRHTVLDSGHTRAHASAAAPVSDRGFDPGFEPGLDRRRVPAAAYDDPPSRTGLFLVVLAALLAVAVGLILAIVNLISQPTDEPGAVMVDVPAVIGETQASATNILVRAGLDPVVDFQETDERAAGLVFAQDPGPGNEVEEGSEVRIIVSESEEMVPVPDVTGQLVSDANAALAEAGFRVAIERRENDTVEPDRVISQSVLGGDEANAGSDILLLVSSGPPASPTTVESSTTTESTTTTTVTTTPSAAPTTSTTPTTRSTTTTTRPSSTVTSTTTTTTTTEPSTTVTSSTPESTTTTEDTTSTDE